MKRKNALLLISVLLCTVAFLTTAVIAAGEMTITGTVNKDHQIVTDDGKAYDLAQSEQGTQVRELVGKKVKVTGAVEESKGKMTINVTGYELLIESGTPEH
jgi:hypothetical protein